jgi:hypothetical protein
MNRHASQIQSADRLRMSWSAARTRVPKTYTARPIHGTRAEADHPIRYSIQPIERVKIKDRKADAQNSGHVLTCKKWYQWYEVIAMKK